jgi:hypothetical protein
MPPRGFMKRAGERSNATGMPMIGPRNAITLQSSKTNLLDGTEIFLPEPCWKAFRDAGARSCAGRVRTVSAQKSVSMVRHTPKTCIDAINAIKSMLIVLSSHDQANLLRGSSRT